MDTYIGTLCQIHIPKVASNYGKLTSEQYHDFESGLGQVRWPVRHVVPELGYAVSKVAQNSKGDLRIAHLKELNTVIKGVQESKSEGRARMVFRKLDLTKLLVATPFDASYAKEVGMKSQAPSVTSRWTNCSGPTGTLSRA